LKLYPQKAKFKNTKTMEKKPFEPPLIKRLNAGMPAKFGLTPRIDFITEIEDIPVNDLMDHLFSFLGHPKNFSV